MNIFISVRLKYQQLGYWVCICYLNQKTTDGCTKRIWFFGCNYWNSVINKIFVYILNLTGFSAAVNSLESYQHILDLSIFLVFPKTMNNLNSDNKESSIEQSRPLADYLESQAILNTEFSNLDILLANEIVAQRKEIANLYKSQRVSNAVFILLFGLLTIAALYSNSIFNTHTNILETMIKVVELNSTDNRRQGMM